MLCVVSDCSTTLRQEASQTIRVFWSAAFWRFVRTKIRRKWKMLLKGKAFIYATNLKFLPPAYGLHNSV